MNKGEQIYQIKQALKKLFSLTNEPEMIDDEMGKKKMFSDYECQDGTKLTTPGTDLEVGVDVFGINLEGNQYALNNGDYKLTDGRVVNVEDNKIKSISEPAMTENSPVTSADLEKQMEEMPTDGEASVEIEVEDAEVVPTAEERIAKIEEEIAKIIGMMTEIQKAHSEMMSNMKKFSEEPASDSIKMARGINSSADPKEFSKRKNVSEIEEIRELIKKNKKENNNTKL
jgi:hypothetical protein